MSKKKRGHKRGGACWPGTTPNPGPHTGMTTTSRSPSPTEEGGGDDVNHADKKRSVDAKDEAPPALSTGEGDGGVDHVDKKQRVDSKADDTPSLSSILCKLDEATTTLAGVDQEDVSKARDMIQRAVKGLKELGHHMRDVSESLAGVQSDEESVATLQGVMDLFKPEVTDSAA